MENRTLYSRKAGDVGISVIEDGEGRHSVSCAMPIVAEGDLIGCVATLSADDQSEGPVPREAEIKLVQTAAGFLGRQLES